MNFFNLNANNNVIIIQLIFICIVCFTISGMHSECDSKQCKTSCTYKLNKRGPCLNPEINTDFLLNRLSSKAVNTRLLYKLLLKVSFYITFRDVIFLRSFGPIKEHRHNWGGGLLRRQLRTNHRQTN